MNKPKCFSNVMTPNFQNYEEDCKTCEFQQKCIEAYNQKVYEIWLDLEVADDEWDSVVLCNLTGEQCVGDPLFCEECYIMVPEMKTQSSGETANE